MQKKQSNVPLPKGQDNNQPHLRDSNDPSIKGLASAIAISMIPVIRSTNKTLIDSMGLMQSYLLSELPDLGLLGGYLSDFVGDIFNAKKEDQKTKVIDDQARDIKVIKKENIDHTNIFDLIYHELDDISTTMRDLLKITSDVWGVSEDQLASIRDSNKIAKESEKLSKFNMQKDKTGDAFSLKDLKLADTKEPKDHPLLKLLESTLIGRLFPILSSIIGSAIVGLVEFFIGSKFLKSIFPMLAPKLLDLTKGLFGKGSNKLSKTFSKAAKVVDDVPTSKLSKIAGTGVGVGKTVMRGVGIYAASAGALGGAQGAYQGYAEGKKGGKLVEATFAGVVDGILSGFGVDTETFNYDAITDAIGQVYANIVLGAEGILTNITDSFSSMWTNIKDTFTSFVDTIVNTVVKLKDDMIDGILSNIRDILQKIIPEENKINVLGYDMKFAPDSLHDFAYPKSSSPQVEPSSKQDQRTIDMMTNQNKIEESQTKYGTPQEGSNINSVVNNVAPVNNTIMAMPIVTRNPDPIFGNYLSF